MTSLRRLNEDILLFFSELVVILYRYQGQPVVMLLKQDVPAGSELLDVNWKQWVSLLWFVVNSIFRLYRN